MSKDNPLVSFLASYGPQPSSNNLYDEFVVKAQKETGCTPIHIEQPLIERLHQLLLSDHPKSVILTGTAGDGKTYTARKVLESLTGSDNSWENTQKVYPLSLPDCSDRSIHFIKDLSELSKNEKEELFPKIDASLRGNRSNQYYVICVNDGHLLKFFREHDTGQDRLHDRISSMLNDHREKDDAGYFLLINMSLQSHQEIVDSIIDAITQHPDWNQCHGCPQLKSDHSPCPIQVNRDILRQNGPDTMRARLKDMIRMAAANSQHLSIRQLILLAVNILMGDQKQGASLLTCRKARRRAENEKYDLTNPYANVFGENLTPRERKQYGAFATLSEFGVGYETNNYFDHDLLENKGKLPQHPIYGERIFAPVRKRYQADPCKEKQEFSDAIVVQRRRLFFSITPKTPDGRDRLTDPWNLSVFNFGAWYIALVDSIRCDKKIPNEIRRHTICGLNRMISRQMTSTDNEIWLAEPSGVFRGNEAPLLVVRARPSVGVGVGAHFAFCKGKVWEKTNEDIGKAPVLRITILFGNEQDKEVELELNPTLLECLLRISNGALPASFPPECHQKIRRFQLRVEASSEKFLPEQIDMNDGKLQGRPIEVILINEE